MRRGVCKIPGKGAIILPMAETKRGRPSAADRQRELIEAVFDRHSNGESLTEICTALGIQQAEFRSWMRKAPADLAEGWKRAKDEFVHSTFDQMASITRQLATGRFGKDDSSRVQALRAAMDGLKHISSRLNPAQYGEQKAGQQMPTIIINTNLPVGLGDQPSAAINGEFSVVLPLEGPK